MSSSNDPKYMIQNLNMEDHVASFTTLCTPHKGSPMASWFLRFSSLSILLTTLTSGFLPILINGVSPLLSIYPSFLLTKMYISLALGTALGSIISS